MGSVPACSAKAGISIRELSRRRGSQDATDGQVAELADAYGSGPYGRKALGVQVPPCPIFSSEGCRQPYPQMLPLRLRNELFALFQSALADAERARCFDWLALFLRLCRRRREPRVPLSQLLLHGQEKHGLHRKALDTLLATGNILTSSNFPPILSLRSSGELKYLEDRLPRFQKVLPQCVPAKSFEAPLLRVVRIAQHLFNQGLFFDCHEYLEKAWKSERGPVKIALQGLIQAAAGFHKLELNSSKGCMELLLNASKKLQTSGTLCGANLRPFAARLQSAAQSIRRGDFRRQSFPRMELPPI